MKVLIIQSDGEHKGQDSFCRNDYLRECWALKYAFIENGIEDVTCWGKRHSNFKDKIDFNSFDLIFVAEQYDTEWLPDLSKITKPKKLHWIIDLHCLGPKPYRKISENCDIVLHSTKSLMPNDPRHIWFPNGVDSRFFNGALYGPDDEYDTDPDKIEETKKTENIIFVGSDLKERRELIDYAKKSVGLKTMFKTGEEMIEAINKTRIHFNKSIAADVNYRNFETIGLCTCLMTNYLPELEELGFKDGDNCLMYKNKEEIKEKYDYTMKDNEWAKIAMGGFLLSFNHTYKQRINKLIEDKVI